MVLSEKLRRFHSVEEVRASISNELRDHAIALGVTGSVAAYKAVDVARRRGKLGADVWVVMTRSATEFVTPMLFEWATGNPVTVEVGGGVEHIALAKMCSSMVIAPATLNTLSKLARGEADNPVVLTAIAMLGMGKPVVAAPAMHAQLFRSPATQRVLEELRGMGMDVLPPVEIGGRLVLPPPEVIAEKVAAVTLRGRDLRGLRILVTAGPTREYIDEVRFISNPSSGLMGVAIANAAYFRGADVVLVAGPLQVEPVPWIRVVRVTSTEEMAEAVKRVAAEGIDAAVLAAAPADYRPAKRFGGKVSSGLRITLELVPTPKVVEELRKVFRGPVIGFAAEYAERDEEAVERGRRKLVERGFDAIAINNVAKKGVGFTSPKNEVFIAMRSGEVIHVGPARKEYVAMVVLDVLKKLLGR
ncbi:MAG: bifunctional phosphopantothenoylcysteine decarboxylase/phosphopantothenate--cysteine ligase CoaBC [Thermoprotei archaeon]|nr:MAG: bifunctional phosphopantothenoylcysteine decarboxylase/phosphopantothenate--cysteine ligase CoaBC [Thermoprotei archaeon]